MRNFSGLEPIPIFYFSYSMQQQNNYHDDDEDDVDDDNTDKKKNILFMTVRPARIGKGKINIVG